MEQSLADLVLRRVITPEAAFSRSSRPDQLRGLLERAGMTNLAGLSTSPNGRPGGTQTPTGSGLRLASEV